MKRILTYGTFDLFHEGHKNILKRARELGDYLVVGVSTDEFNNTKGKQSVYNYEMRKRIVESQPYVDLVIPENSWDQKITDVLENNIDIVVMGSDWAGSDKFDYLKQYCEVIYLPRTPGISSTEIKQVLNTDDCRSLINAGFSDFDLFNNGLDVLEVSQFEQVGGIIKVKKL